MTDHPDIPQADAFASAVERLRDVHNQLLAEPTRSISDVGEQTTVLDNFQPVFSVEHLPELSADKFTSFLRFENNKHWTGINRYGSRMTQDMGRLREALAILLDESRPLAERYDTATGMISGLSKATATPILLVAYPKRYGVWNSISEIGLRELDLWPELPRSSSDGAQYAAVNEVLNKLAEALEIDLWTLDALWDVMSNEDHETEYWRITLPDDRYVKQSETGEAVDVWSICLENGIAAIDYDNNRDHGQVQQFAKIRPGDKVIAFLRNKQIGGIGTVTNGLDEELYKEQPPELDLFGGEFWFRIGVDWTERPLSVDDLPTAAANMFGQGTVSRLGAERYQMVIDAIDGKPPLAEPFSRIFRDRDEAEWAFDFLAKSVQKMGGGPDAMNFALTMPRNQTTLSLNFGNSSVTGFAEQKDTFGATLLAQPTLEHFDFGEPRYFTEDKLLAGFDVPIAIAREWPAELARIYDASMPEIASLLKWNGRSIFHRHHYPEVFAALFDRERRAQLFDEGLPSSPSGAGDKSFSQSDVFPIIARLINDLYKNREDWIPHNEIKQSLLLDPEGNAHIEQAHKKKPEQSHDTIAANMIAWFSQQYTADPNFPYRNQFERTDDKPYAYRPNMKRNPIIVDGPSIANEFKGFTADTFAFLTQLDENNNKAWMHDNKDRYINGVREPMRHLFADVGPYVKPVFDRYLSPDVLEIKADAKHVLSKINKNWNATPDSMYYTWYWGAFYREDLSKLTDAQLFVNLQRDHLRFGFYIGDVAHKIRQQFIERVQNDPDGFYDMVQELRLLDDFAFYRAESEGTITPVTIESTDDFKKWLGEHNFGILRILSDQEAISLGSRVVDEVLAAHRRVFPIYLWAVADDPQQIIERYLVDELGDSDNLDEVEIASYTERDFREKTYLTENTINDLRDMLNDRKQIIFSGPPGTGKTYVARELGKLLTGLADPPPDRMTIIQFHPSYSYEDFIEGIRPKSKEADGRTIVDYPTLPGVFQKFCREAQGVDGPCVFIIDEINRGNIPRIFGELMLLMEYRDQQVTLPYSGKRFSIPDNVRIIGTMNTADRSIALVDFALRRRFHFFEFAADPDLFDRWLRANQVDVPYLGRLYRRLAKEAIEDRHFAIGPSHFMQTKLNEEKLERIWRRSIVPYLEEYYFDQPEQARKWAWHSDLVSEIRGSHNAD